MASIKSTIHNVKQQKLNQAHQNPSPLNTLFTTTLSFFTSLIPYELPFDPNNVTLDPNTIAIIAILLLTLTLLAKILSLFTKVIIKVLIVQVPVLLLISSRLPPKSSFKLADELKSLLENDPTILKTTKKSFFTALKDNVISSVKAKAIILGSRTTFKSLKFFWMRILWIVQVKLADGTSIYWLGVWDRWIPLGDILQLPHAVQLISEHLFPEVEPQETVSHPINIIIIALSVRD